MTKCKEELAVKYQELEKTIGETSPELLAKTDPYGFRDYQARLRVMQGKHYIGDILLAYSPNRAVYTANLAAIRDDVAASTLCEICAATGCRLAGGSRQPRQPGPIMQDTPATNHTRIEQARTAADLLLKALAKSGIQAEFAGIYNHYVRLNLLFNQGVPARIDIYNTAKHQLELRFTTPPANSEDAARIGKLWAPIRTSLLGGESSSASPSQSAEAAMRRADVYYKTLQKYAKCDFDFIDLAIALKDEAHARGLAFPELDEVRYDFAELERNYKAMAAI
jgi:hypothetical protein